MVVDHDDGMRVLVSELLEAAGFAVAEAGTGETALSLAGSARPQLALVDVFLPGLSGYELCHRLKVELGSRRSRLADIARVAGPGRRNAARCGRLRREAVLPGRAVRARAGARQPPPSGLAPDEVPDDDARPDDARGDRNGVQERRHQS